MDNETLLEATDIYLESMDRLKEAKQKFKDFIVHKNSRRFMLADDITTHLSALVEMWNDTPTSGTDHYFAMKDHHIHITGRIDDPELRSKWDAYMMRAAEARSLLMYTNHMITLSRVRRKRSLSR